MSDAVRDGATRILAEVKNVDPDHRMDAVALAVNVFIATRGTLEVADDGQP
jgi:hypothetical protein